MMQATPLVNVKEQEQTVSEILQTLKDTKGALLPILHKVQDSLGYIPECAVRMIATQLNMSRADVHGIITFYHHFTISPGGKYKLYVCRAEACQSMGSEQLEAHIKRSLNVDEFETTADGKITLEAVYCLGNCANAPSIRLDDDIHGRVTTQKVDTILAELP